MDSDARPSDTTEHYTQLLVDFADAWNRHDVDALMDAMTEDCVFLASAGPNACGRRYEGRDAVRQAYADMFNVFPDAAWLGPSHVVAGTHGYSSWTFVGTHVSTGRVEVDGCDLFTFNDGRIAVKNSFRKARTA